MIESTFETELQNYKAEAIQKFNLEHRDLENKRTEKQKKLNQALQEITSNTVLNGKINPKTHTEIQIEYQSKIKQMNEFLLSKVFLFFLI